MTLDEIRALCAAATPGPWVPDVAESETTIGPECMSGAGPLTDYGQAQVDARFIAAARTLLPALLEVAEAASEAPGATLLHDWQPLERALAALKLPPA